MKRQLRLLVLPVILILFALTSLSCGGDDDDDNNPMNPGGGGTADHTVTIALGSSNAGAGAYSPNPLNMTAGQTVRWVNNDNMLHTATHATAFSVSVPAGSQSGLITMSNAGTFNYICTVAGHTMSGQIVVAP